MRITVGTTPVPFPTGGRGRPVLRNMGPGTVYLDVDSAVSADTGLPLNVGDTYEFPTSGGHTSGMYLVSDLADTDVRVLMVGG